MTITEDNTLVVDDIVVPERVAGSELSVARLRYTPNDVQLSIVQLANPVRATP